MLTRRSRNQSILKKIEEKLQKSPGKLKISKTVSNEPKKSNAKLKNLNNNKNSTKVSKSKSQLKNSARVQPKKSSANEESDEWEEVKEINNIKSDERLLNENFDENLNNETFLKDFKSNNADESNSQYSVSIAGPTKIQLRQLKVRDWVRMMTNRMAKIFRTGCHLIYLQIYFAHIRSLYHFVANNQDFEAIIKKLIQTNKLKLDPKLDSVKNIEQIIGNLRQKFPYEKKRSCKFSSNFLSLKQVQKIKDGLIKLENKESNFILILFAVLIRLNFNVKLCFLINPPDLDYEHIKPEVNKSNLKKGISQINISDLNDQNSSTENKTPLESANKQKSSKPKKSVGLNSQNSCHFDCWLEIILDCEKPLQVNPNLIFIDPSKNKPNTDFIDFRNMLDQKSIKYIAGIDQSGNFIDLTLRYCTNWSVVRKKHPNFQYYTNLLKSGQKDNQISEIEDGFTKNLVDKFARPQTPADVKLHPHFVSQNDILKYEAIYPNDCQPLYLIRNAPVYSRFDLHGLHTSEKWIQNGMQIKKGEEPYKIVKSVKRSENNERLDSSLYGPWQIEKFDPPAAVNGIVPKNDHGNVYLFQMSMLPKNTEYICLPNFNKILIKNNKDFAPAMIGWDFHGGSSHPVIGGFVVCKEDAAFLKKEWLRYRSRSNTLELLKKYEMLSGKWMSFFKTVRSHEKVNKEYKK